MVVLAKNVQFLHSTHKHSNLHTMDSVSMKYGYMFTVRHLVRRSEVGIVLYNLLVLSLVLHLPLLAVDGAVHGVADGVVDGVVDAICFFDCVHIFLHIRVQRLQSQRGQTKNRICPLSFLLRTMLLHRQPDCFVLW